MLRSKKAWKITERHPESVQTLVSEVQCSELVAHLLYNRGFHTRDDAHAFLHRDQIPYYDPFLMLGMEKAVERITAALENEEHILVFGDYDADGVTSTSLLVLALRELGASVSYYIPDRFREGYGPNIPAIEQAKARGISLIVTVDTGISAVSSAERAKSLGIDYIITDHHEPPPNMPDAYAIINPKQPGCAYPFKGLAGVGVALKLVQALMDEVPTHLLDLAAVGTISDLVPLVDENRRLVKEGLYVLSHHPKPGLKALMKVAGHAEQEPVNSDVVGFQIGPRLNAAGRLKHASLSADLLMSDDLIEAEALAEEVNLLNEERKKLVESIAVQAVASVERMAKDDRDFLIVAMEGWHEGVLGIVASRLVEQYYRPTLVLSIHPETGMAKGSARSIEGFDLFQALSTCRDVLPHFGGHEMAAGLSLPQESIGELRERMNHYARQQFTEELLTPKLKIDADLNLEEVTVSIIEELASLEPYGVGNPKPKFRLKELSIQDMKQVGTHKAHLKVTLKDSSEVLDGISFGHGHLYHEMSMDVPLSVVGELGINEWNGFRKPQIFIEDFQIDHWQLFDLRGNDRWRESVTQTYDASAIWVYFQNETLKHFDLEPSGAVYFEDLKQSGQKLSSVVFLDVPSSLSELQGLLASIPFPNRIYAVFEASHDLFGEGLPQRDHFKQIFALFNKHQNIPMNKLKAWATYKGWPVSQIDFILKVFLELEFVKLDKDVLTLNATPSKRPLTESKTYQKRLHQNEVDEVLVYSSKSDLKAWLNQANENRTVTKEDVLS